MLVVVTLRVSASLRGIAAAVNVDDGNDCCCGLDDGGVAGGGGEGDGVGALQPI